MMPRLNPRTLVLGIALALTLVAVVAVNRMDTPEAVVGTVSKERHPDDPGHAAPTGAKADLGVQNVADSRKNAPAKPSANVFSARSFYVPPPPKPVVHVEPPPPEAPPLPFTFVGRFDEKGVAPVVFLTNGDQLYTVRAGDVIDNVYRIESLTREEVVFIYLPMDERQVLRIAEAP